MWFWQERAIIALGLRLFRGTPQVAQSSLNRLYFERFFVLHSLEVIFSFLIKVKAKAREIEIAFFFIPLGIPRVAHWIISFMLHISIIISPINWYLYRWVNWNISEVINEDSTSAFNYWDDFTQYHYSSHGLSWASSETWIEFDLLSV